MKMMKIISILAIIIVFMANSCSDSFLEPKPLSFYAPENVLTRLKNNMLP